MTEETYLFDSNLSAAVEDLIKEAKSKLTLISPYIDLADRVRTALTEQLDRKDPNFELKVLFGKNGKSNLIKGDPKANKLKDSLRFLMRFPNVEIRFEKRLHAKFYINDYHMIFSSMNLYNYSLQKNIEFGIVEKYASKGLLRKAVDATDEMIANLEDKIAEKVVGSRKMVDPVEKFERIFKESELLYKSKPKLGIKKGFKAKVKGAMGIDVKEIIGTEVSDRKLLELLGDKTTTKRPTQPQTAGVENETGYCIRTSEKIPFNPRRPLSDTAFKSWSKYKDGNYKEKFCHYSGEPSNGETSMARPILKKNWKIAMGK